MFAVRTSLSGLIVLALAQTMAAADPIQLSLWGDVDGHVISQSITLSDPSQPINIGPFTQQFLPTILPDGQYTGSGTINSYFFLQVTDTTPGSPASGDYVVVSGNVQGSYKIDSPYLPNMDGSVYGSGTGAGSLFLAPGSSAADVPPYLADLLNHPERVTYGGIISGGAMDLMTTTLSIAPPVDPNAVVPAPEPSMLAITLMAVASFAVVRRWRSRPS
jgi:hypothetical protein